MITGSLYDEAVSYAKKARAFINANIKVSRYSVKRS